MTGLTDYSSKATLNWLAGSITMPALGSGRWLALFTAVGSDTGTGFTEVSGGSYARIQIAGTITAAGAISTGSSTITMPNVSGYPWVVAGMNVYDLTAGAQIGTVLSWTGTTLTLTGNAASNGSGSTDSLTFSAFSAASGSAPSQIVNTSAVITFAQATASWGTVIAFGEYDASSSGNLLSWDFLGNYSWLPFEVASGSGPTWNVKGNGYASNDPVVVTAEYGGTLPSASTGTFTSYTVNYVASPATDSVQIDTVSGPSTPCVLTSSGSGMVRKILQQSIPINTQPSFSSSTLTITLA